MSERLEEMKEWFYNDEELHQFQIEWLFKQAKKAEQYEKFIDKALYLLGTEDYYKQGVVEQIQAELAMSFGEIRRRR